MLYTIKIESMKQRNGILRLNYGKFWNFHIIGRNSIFLPCILDFENRDKISIQFSISFWDINFLN